MIQPSCQVNPNHPLGTFQAPPEHPSFVAPLAPVVPIPLLHGRGLNEVGNQKSATPWKINMEHNNGGLEDDFPFQTGDFQVPAVNFPGCNWWFFTTHLKNIM